MVLNGVFLGMISLRSDIINYFGIPNPTPAELAFTKYTGSIAAHTRNRFSQRLDSEVPTGTPIAISKKTGVTKERGKIIKGRGGKPIKVPTELFSTPATAPSTNAGQTVIRRPQVRYVTIRFPGSASMGEISAWLFTKMTTKKPKTFQSPSGKAYSVSPLVAGAVVSGENTTP